MKEEEGNIFTVFDDLINRNEKELLLNQKSKVIWMTGLSGSGKTTIAKALEKKLHLNNIISQLHDGDNIRVGISNNLSFSSEDRLENIRRISEISKLFLNCGIVTLNCFISPTNEIRQIAKDIIGENDFIEIYINASLKICEDRDVKGLYKKARNGEIKNFTGISATYEEPKQPNLVINTTLLSIEESVKKIYDYILPLIKNK
ncbi:adenylyl-sulfate kinase [Flavobacteriales bacterium]|jgi:adenylylsulfate kinase|nr:adenylyl-sulfate kinase [Flavobacteriales bacterium]MBT6882381.1 adenylyl-sulfate kinase [Flavobacterium sp.]MDA7578491.1 adenylyl-sulfate kinase [Flavobacteriales bacterium]MDC0908662.1 adenylyl-sulfate kinase [Flavobacteriales bacterium]